jgi:hypothetical protein
MRSSCFRTTLRRALWLPLCCSAALAWAQDATRDVLVRNWDRSSTDQRISAISAALSSSASENKALALSGVARLVVEDRASAQRRFPASSIRPYLQDPDAEVARQAARAYVAISDSDETAEADIVAIAASGRSPLLPHEYIRYLRPKGITSEAARQWLTSLAQGPLSVEKHSAVEALVILNGMPPASLLPQVMELIRSPEYFCATNLVLSLKDFGRPAARYVDELVELRAKLEAEAKLPVDARTVVLRTEFATAASVMDEAIAALQKL